MIKMIKINKYIPHIACILALSTLISITALVCDNKRDRLEKEKTQDQITQSTRPSETTKVPQTSTGAPTPGDVGDDGSLPSIALPAEPTVSAERAFLYDADTDRLIWSKGELDSRLYPASLTKLWTVLVALNYVSPDTRVTVGDEVSLIAADSSKAGITKGMRVDVEDLIYAMLLPSGNDAAYALAAACGRAIVGQDDLSGRRAVDIFVERMNEHAMQEGMTDSHFTNPDGYHDADHYTTSADMIKIVKMSLESELIVDICSTASIDVSVEDGTTLSLKNSNLLVNENSKYYLPEAIGLKTGHTKRAGYCLVAAAKFDGRTVVAAVFGGENVYSRFDDAITLFDAIRDQNTK